MSPTTRCWGHLSQVDTRLVGIASQARAQEPWQTPDGRACIDAWTRHVSERLNSYAGSGEFNSRKPWSINQYGLFVGRGIRSNYAPDNWAQLGANRHQWMWGTYTTGLQYPNWNNANFNAAGLQGLRYFVRECVAGRGGGGGAGSSLGGGAGGTGGVPVSGGAMAGVNLPGSDYSDFWQDSPGAGACQARCVQEARCQAWTYVRPGVQGARARCWLKSRVPASKPDACCVSGVKASGGSGGGGSSGGGTGAPRGAMAGVNLPGSDYSNFWQDVPGAGTCQSRCEQEARCQAWTYVKPGVQGSRARCWLKSGVPASRPDACCVSGVKASGRPGGGGGSGGGASVPRGAMAGTNLPGSDYTNFRQDSPNPGVCQAACRQDSRCRAWTYVKPGMQGAQARCWLKNAIPARRAESCCVSGIERP